jgi:Leucine-rich repeat (LRR) protein
MSNALHSLFIALGVLISLPLAAQQSQLPAADMEDYSHQTEQLVEFLQETLNFIGQPGSTVQEKEIIINESYLKFFLDAQVQIEDDLDENREIPINKDVQAYLKDVDFFFRQVHFTFEIEKIDQMVSQAGDLFFRVELNRELRGITLRGDSVNNLQKRFMEINLDPFRKELKIASIYTSGLNEREELRNWWNTMPMAWKRYFGQEVMFDDTLSFDRLFSLTPDAVIVMRPTKLIRRDTVMVMDTDTLSLAYQHLLHGRPPDTLLFRADTLLVFMPDTIVTDMARVHSTLKRFTKQTEVNISYKQQFASLEPLAQLTDLRIVDFSNTPIHDLLPLRNLNQLDAIYMSGSSVSNLTPLRYSVNIKEIYCFDTPVDDLSPLSAFRKLEKLYCFNTAVSSLEPLRNLPELIALRAGKTKVNNLEPLSNLHKLRLLDVSQTAISDLSPLANLKELQMLVFEQTAVSSLEPLRDLEALSIIQFSNTNVDDLSPLDGKNTARKIYCDNTLVSSEMAVRFMRNNQGSLVIFESEELSAWWNSLPIYWKALLSEQTGKPQNPGTEDLHEIINIKQLDLSGNRFLQNLQPVGRLANLSYLSLRQTEIVDLNPLIGLNALVELDLSDTRISDLMPLNSLIGLEQLNIERTRVENLEPIANLTGLRLVYADNSRVDKKAVEKIKSAIPNTLIIFQTNELQQWWKNLPDRWRDVFESYVPVDANPTPIQLQSIAELRHIELEGIQFSTLEPLRKLPYLEKLVVVSTSISDLQALSGNKRLKHLELPNNPVSNLKPINSLTKLEVLNIENTPVSDLSAIGQLADLRTLNISGTQLRNLKALSDLTTLEDLSFYNTRIRKTSPIENLPSLKYVKCYNTRISSRNIQKWRSKRPNLNILYY